MVDKATPSSAADQSLFVRGRSWTQENLFATPLDTAITLAMAVLLVLVVWPVIDWAIVSAIWTGEDGRNCRAAGAGACWPFIGAKLNQFIFGRYPIEEQWRVILVFALGGVSILWLAWPNAPKKTTIAIFLLVLFPLLAAVLLTGGWLGLSGVETNLWGGMLITLVVAFVGIVASLPLGVLLALGRQSKLPLVRYASIAFIEFWRAVPLVIFLFMASNMLPLFFPAGVTVDKLMRALVAVALFSSAYMAEVVRGGLQAVPKGQFEAALSLGMGYWRAMAFIVLPQALKHVLPGIVNTFIGLFKDTSLVYVIGLFDMLGVITVNLTDPTWFSAQTAATGYVFVAFVFWVFCFAMSRYSVRLEQNLGQSQQSSNTFASLR